MSVLVTLPAYNEAANLPPLVRRIHELGYKCIVVDDGSSDDTLAVAEGLGAAVVRHPINLGQGFAVLTGFKAALLDPECDIVVEMDGDGQHDPDDLPHLLKRLEEAGTDIVVGSRILGSDYPNAPFFRRTFLPYYTAMINRLTGYRLTDAMCGLRVFRARSLAEIAPMLDEMLEPQYLAAEMFIRFARAGLTVAEAPIHMRDRTFGQSYKGLVRYGYGVVRAALRTVIDPKLPG